MLNNYRFLKSSQNQVFNYREDHSDVPHIIINGKVYYPKANLRKWLLNLGE